MKKISAYILSFVMIFTLCFAVTACSGSGKGDDGYDYTIIEDDAHYLVFKDNNTEIARLVVREEDTYESMKPYFPTIPREEGYNLYWQEVKEVYKEGETEVTIFLMREKI